MRLNGWLRQRLEELEARSKALELELEAAEAAASERIEEACAGLREELSLKTDKVASCQQAIESCEAATARLRKAHEQELDSGRRKLAALVASHSSQALQSAFSKKIEAQNLEASWAAERESLLREIAGLEGQIAAARMEEAQYVAQEKRLREQEESHVAAMAQLRPRLEAIQSAAAVAISQAELAEQALKDQAELLQRAAELLVQSPHLPK